MSIELGSYAVKLGQIRAELEQRQSNLMADLKHPSKRALYISRAAQRLPRWMASFLDPQTRTQHALDQTAERLTALGLIAELHISHNGPGWFASFLTTGGNHLLLSMQRVPVRTGHQAFYSFEYHRTADLPFDPTIDPLTNNDRWIVENVLKH